MKTERSLHIRKKPSLVLSTVCAWIFHVISVPRVFHVLVQPVFWNWASCLHLKREEQFSTLPRLVRCIYYGMCTGFPFIVYVLCSVPRRFLYKYRKHKNCRHLTVSPPPGFSTWRRTLLDDLGMSDHV